MRDEFLTRVPVDGGLSDMLHSVEVTEGTMDAAMFPLLCDFDADGDNDLILGVAGNVPRFLRNRGSASFYLDFTSNSYVRISPRHLTI